MDKAAEVTAPPAGRPSQPVYVLAQVLDLSRRRWAVIAGATVALCVLATGVALLQPPLYRATAELIVDPLGLQVVGRDIERSDSASTLDLAGVDSQAYVLTSTPVLRRVVDGLGLADDRDYQAHAGWLARILGEAAQRSLRERETDAVEILRKDLAVKRVEGALVFQITASARGAARAADIANAVADAYIRQVTEERVETVQRAGSSLLQQVAPLRAQLDAAETAVERFRSDNALVRSSETGLVVTQQIKDLYTQIDVAEAELARLDARRDQIGKASPDDVVADALPEAANSASMVSLRAQYAGTAREIASLDRTLMPGHPRMVELRAELAETRRLIRLELGRLRSSAIQAAEVARANVANLRLRAGKLTQSKNDSSAAEIKLRELEGEAAAVRAVYDAALSRSRELQQQQSIVTQNSRVLTEAAPPSQRANPRLAVVALMGALFGACLGFGLAYLREMWPARRAGQPFAAEPAPAERVAAGSMPIPARGAALAAGARRR